MRQGKALFTPLKNERSFEKVSSRIKGLIFDGVLSPGDKLPSENELAQQFSVSRQTVREALRILELSGFITTQKGGSGGPLIKDTILNTISNLYLDAFRMEKISIRELTLVRCEIEKLVLSHAIDKADESDIAALKQNILLARGKIEDNATAIDEHIEFHNLLARASKNHVFVIVAGSLTAAVREMMTRIVPKAPDDTVRYDEQLINSKHSVRYHEKILEAILKKDKEGACQVLEEHLTELEQRVRSFMA